MSPPFSYSLPKKLLFSNFYFKAATTSTFYISQGKSSTDSFDCGSYTKPCKSLHMVLNSIKNADNIIVYCDYRYPCEFVLKQDIRINFNNITISGSGYSNLTNRPKIIFSNQLDKKQQDFFLQTGYHLRLSQLALEIGSMLRTVDSYIVYENCNITFQGDKDKNDTTIFMAAGRYLFKHSLIGSHHKVHFEVYPYGDVNHVNLVIRQSEITCFLKFNLSSTIDINITDSNLTKNFYVFNNAIKTILPRINIIALINSKVLGAFWIGRCGKIDVQHTLFLNKAVFYTQDNDNVVLKSSNFTNSTMHSIRDIQAHIRNCNFYASNDILFEGSKVSILYSPFQHCRGLYGGALYSNDTTLTISHSNFINNTASNTGGNIYSVGTKPLTISNTNFTSVEENQEKLYGTTIYSISPLILQNVTIILTHTIYSQPIIFAGSHSSLEGRNLFRCPHNHIINVTKHRTPELTDLPEIRRAEMFTITCASCHKGSYNMSHSYGYINNTLTDIHNVACHECPLGGTCWNTITSSNNYWGYKDRAGKLFMLLCPPYYCCTSKTNQCTSYNTCEYNREGRLCGRCKDGFHLDLISDRCIDRDKCKKQGYAIFFIVSIISWLFGMLVSTEVYKRC